MDTAISTLHYLKTFGGAEQLIMKIAEASFQATQGHV